MSDIGVKKILGKIWGFQILNVGQIFIEKCQKRPKAFKSVIQFSKIDA